MKVDRAARRWRDLCPLCLDVVYTLTIPSVDPHNLQHGETDRRPLVKCEKPQSLGKLRESIFRVNNEIT